jgi:hypothetical protein
MKKLLFALVFALMFIGLASAAYTDSYNYTKVASEQLGGDYTSLANTNDGNYNTYGTAVLGYRYIYKNYSLLGVNINSVNFTAKEIIYSANTNITHYYFNYTKNDWQYMYVYNNSGVFGNGNISSDGLKNILQIKVVGYYSFPNGDASFFESSIAGNATNRTDFTEISQTYNNNTYETASETFSMGLFYDSNYYGTVSANLIYEGTSYPGTITSNGLYYVASTTITIPAISGTSQNKSFYWQLGLTNATNTYLYNSNQHNQTVSSITFGDCAGANNILALNITAFDQSNGTSVRVNPFSIRGSLTYSPSLSSTNKKSFNFLNNSIAEKDICLNKNATVYLSGLIEYSANNYQTSTYYFVNTPVTNITTNLSLGLLASASNTNFIIQLNDQNNLPVQGYYIKINRCYANDISSCQNVQMVKTDGNGQSVAFIESYTPFYQFVVLDGDGNVVLTTDMRKISPQVSPYTITLTIGSSLPNPISYLANITGLTESISWDKNTYLATLSYADTSSNFSLGRFLVVLQNPSGSDTVICNLTSSNPSAVIICDLTGNQTGTYSAQFYLTRGSTTVMADNLLFDIEDFSTTVGMLGIFGGFIILLVCGFIFAYNEVAGIIMINIAIIGCNIIGFVHFGIVPITAIIAISIIILIVLERG